MLSRERSVRACARGLGCGGPSGKRVWNRQLVARPARVAPREQGAAPRAREKGGEMCRLLLVAVLALVLLGPPTAVGASEQWCETDPLVVIDTPGGSRVLVYVTNGALGTEHLPAVLAAHMSYTAQPAEGGRATRVTLDVRIPDDDFGRGFPTRSVVSTGPLKTGRIYAAAGGVSGQPMRMTFTLAVR